MAKSKKKQDRRIWHDTYDVLRETYTSWREDRTLRLGAGLAFYALLTIIPILTLLISMADIFFSQAEVESYISNQITAIFGENIRELTDKIMVVVTETDGDPGWYSFNIISTLSLIFASSLLFMALQDALNVIWHRPAVKGAKKYVIRHLVAFAVALITGGLFILSLVLHTVVAFIEKFLPDLFGLLDSAVSVATAIATWLLGVFLVTILFRLLIYVKVPWYYLIIGATATSVMLTLGTSLLGVYFATIGGISFTGAVGGVFLIMLWIYYEAQIFLAGAQLTKTLAKREIKIPGVPEHIKSL